MKNPLAQVRKAIIVARLPRRSPEWQRVRACHLKNQPWCKRCGRTSDLEVHHIVPFHLDSGSELDPDNLITLCESAGSQCHLRNGHLGNWRSFNPYVISEATSPGPLMPAASFSLL